ncbi:unnamed protein product [Durusdinium trenchii]|uniref:Uncharacterized protein n=1 Tax=Durusdinium trenchii TaxID=1381693 RepID=A0ABP0T044_9DINO
MPPRGKTPAVALPVEDALLELPEGMEVQDPPFSFVLAHLVSHTFHVEAEAEGTEGDVGVQDFDPLESLSRYHEGDAPHTSNVLLLTRDELEGFAEGGTFAAGMRRKAEAEFLCRRRKKVNEARQKAIDDGGSMESDDSEMDLIVIVSGYPSTPEEVDELEDAGLFDLADAFVSIHLAGETLIDEPDETGATRRIAKMIGAPPAITALREKVLGAESGTPLASTIVTELYNCHEWALSQGFEVIDPCRVIVGAISFAAQRRISYKEWLSALPEDRVVIPSVDPIERTDTSVYERLVESTDPAHHDVSFMLYCLCEQVNQSLKGDTAEVPAARQKPSAEQMKDLAEKELAMIEKLLDNTCDGLLLGQDAAKKSEDKSHEVVGSLMAMVEQEEMEAERGSKEEEAPQQVPQTPNPGLGSCAPEDLDEDLVIPYHDRMRCRHVGHRFPGGKSVALEIEQILSHLNAPGINRQNFPFRVSMTAAERSAHRNRIYKYMPSMPVVELERLLLLREFQHLLHEAQPERQWNLKDWVFQEKISASLLSQTILEASCRDYFVNMKYMERQDCLLVAMHYRALPGRVLWHSWEGDLLTLSQEDGHQGQELKLCPMPTFHDWWQLVSGQPSPAPPAYEYVVEGGIFKAPPKAKKADARGGNMTQRPVPPPLCPKKVLDLDAREVGYCKVIEKILVPSDKSIILRTAFQRGAQCSVPELAKEGQVVKPVVEDEDEGEDSGLEEDEVLVDPFVPLPRKELHSVRVIKDNLTFGMVSDAAWLETVEALREARLSKEEALSEEPQEDEDAKLAAAQAAADVEKDGEEEDEHPQEEEEEEGGEAVNVTERNLEESRFGCLWAVFKDGTRCTVRMHHERLWYTPGDVSWDVTSSRPGVQVCYTPPFGVVVQAFSDASIRQSWPPQRLFPKDGREADRMLPGQEQDIELARVATAFGVLMIERLSGRKEVFHASGTRAWRNPTVEELQERSRHFTQLASKKGCDAAARACAQRLAEICAAWEANNAEVDEMDPDGQIKCFGLPGHWRVTTCQGRRFGRARTVEEAEASGSRLNSKRPSQNGSDPRTGSKAESGSKPGSNPSSKPHSKDVPAEAEEEEEEDLESEPDPPEPPPSLQDILEAVLVDEGGNIEYELDPVPMLVQRDPHTGITTTTNEEGMMILAYPDDLTNLCVLPDGTRMSQTEDAEGTQVVIEKDGAARVTCFINDKAYVPNSMVKVEIDHGATMEVVPRRLNLKAELVSADPHTFLAKLRGEPEDDVSPALEIAQQQAQMNQHEFCRNPDPREESFSTNASVILRHPEGTLVHSKGAGEVELVSGIDIAAVGGESEKALKMLQDKGCVYMAQVDYDRIYLRDDDGNHFEVKGDQSLDFKLSVSMGDDFASPRCVCPQKPFKHPDASFLPLPEQAPQPRLFIVYGDGEAEELLVRRDFEEAIRLARKDPHTLVVEGEKMGWPMSCCKTHSIHRIMHMDPVNVPMRPLELPHGICGFVEPPPSPLKRTFTEFRQFIEYPELTEQKLQEFESAYEVYLQQEEEQRTLHSTLGQGLQNAQRGSMQKTSTLDPSKFREAASSEPGEASTSDLAREGGA